MKTMKISTKIWDFLNEYGVFMLIFAIVLIITGLILYIITDIITAPDLAEGLVMNKRFSPGYLYCYDGKCHASSDRWIIEVQNGDQKDWWTVTESYYDEVKLGEWVTK